jgi:hypothetical protein
MLNNNEKIKPLVNIMLPNGHCLPKALCDSVKHQVEDIIPAMIPGVGYTLKMLCGKEYWKQLSVGERLWAGLYIAYLVATNGLPLSFGQDTGSHHKTYRV